jgi:hypothetical protein
MCLKYRDESCCEVHHLVGMDGVYRRCSVVNHLPVILVIT